MDPTLRVMSIHFISSASVWPTPVRGCWGGGLYYACDGTTVEPHVWWPTVWWGEDGEYGMVSAERSYMTRGWCQQPFSWESITSLNPPPFTPSSLPSLLIGRGWPQWTSSTWMPFLYHTILRPNKPPPHLLNTSTSPKRDFKGMHRLVKCGIKPTVKTAVNNRGQRKNKNWYNTISVYSLHVSLRTLDDYISYCTSMTLIPITAQMVCLATAPGLLEGVMIYIK